MSKSTYVTVYRYESKKVPAGRRPLQNADSHWHNLPTPNNDSIRVTNLDKYNCGCKWLKQLYTWWPKRKWILLNPIGHIVKLKVPKKIIKEGRKQVIFNRKHPQIIFDSVVYDPIKDPNNIFKRKKYD